MKRRREDPGDEARHKYAGIFNLLFDFAGPEDDFVLAFVAQGLAHLAFAPRVDDYMQPTIAQVAETNRFFYRAYHEAHRKIIFPELDRRFDAFAKAYEAWMPLEITDADRESHPWIPRRKTYLFEPLSFKSSGGRYPRPVVAQVSVLHWLARHRYHTPMSAGAVVNINTALDADEWNSWFQCEIKKDAGWNILGRSWHEHGVPTLACAAIAHSHRSVIGAVNALMWADVDNSDRAKQREFITIWIFYGMMASLWNRHHICRSSWRDWASDLVIEDKIYDRLIRNGTDYRHPEQLMYFVGIGDD